MRFKAIVVNSPKKDMQQVLNIGCAEAKKALRTSRNLDVADILYSGSCDVYVLLVSLDDEVPQRLGSDRRDA